MYFAEAASALNSRVREIALFYRVECPAIGVTIKERLKIGNGKTVLINLPVIDLKSSFDNGLLHYV